MDAHTKVLLLKNKTVPIDPYETNFQQNGFDVDFIPLIEHKHLPQECLEIFQNATFLENLQHIVISSQRTVECLNESIMPRLTSDQQEALQNKTIYTVGPATASFLERCGFKDVRGGINAGNGGVLADLIIEELERDKFALYPEILLLVGETRRDIIPKKLASVGLKPREVVTYTTSTLVDNLQRFKQSFSPHSWVVFFSPQGADEIVDYLKKVPVKVASIGPTTEKVLTERGLSSTVVSSKPEPHSLTNSLKST